jgi:hypothetical protein
MATRKSNSKNQTREPEQPPHMAEATPNPQGQQKVVEMPLRPDQRKLTPYNVGQNPSTVENRMDPSVAVSMEDTSTVDTDSMFNSADWQARELLQENNARNRSHLQRRAGRHEKSRRTRKIA